MNQISINKLADALINLNFIKVFVEYLGWEPPNLSPTHPIIIKNLTFEATQIACLGNFSVFNLKIDVEILPKKELLSEVHNKISELFGKNAIIFTDKSKNQCWYWNSIYKDTDSTYKQWNCAYYLLRGQTGNLFISKILNLYTDLKEYIHEGTFKAKIIDADKRLRSVLDEEKIAKKILTEYRKIHIDFASFIEGFENKNDCDRYAGVLLNRLMFIYFLQKNGFLDNKDFDYLRIKLHQFQENGQNQYYSKFLQILFFEGFTKSANERNSETNAIIGKIPYFIGGLFLPFQLELSNEEKIGNTIFIPDRAFDIVFNFFEKYSWNLSDFTAEKKDEINPDVPGYIFEKYLNQKEFGAYYTKPELTEFLCKETIFTHILRKVNQSEYSTSIRRNYDSIEELLMVADSGLVKKLIGLTETGIIDPEKGILSQMSILDPACGSGAFLTAALKILVDIYAAIYSRMDVIDDPIINRHKTQIIKEYPSLQFYIIRKIITGNLFGVDISKEAIEMARLRLLMELLASVKNGKIPEQFPNLDFNLMSGNSLIGLLNVNESVHKHWPQKIDIKQPDIENQNQFSELVVENQKLIEIYIQSDRLLPDADLRYRIDLQRRKANSLLNRILLKHMSDLKIKHESVTVNDRDKKKNKFTLEKLQIEHIEALNPFHWGYEFNRIMSRGGFDILIGNPPWEVLQADEKEFFQQYESSIKKKNTRIEDWKKQFQVLMDNKARRDAWFKHADTIRLYTNYLRRSTQYPSVQKGKINLYAYFTEQFYNLLKEGGLCGIIIPSGFYTDLHCKGLRELLFSKNQVKSLFCFENRKKIFKNVDCRFKFITLLFEKGDSTKNFQAVFMRQNLDDLEIFRQKPMGVSIKVDFIKRLSPDSFSIMEFKNELEIQIVEKMLQYPSAGNKPEKSWNIKLSQEFNMTTDSFLFRKDSKIDCYPLYEGKMINQFQHDFAQPRRWVDLEDGRNRLPDKFKDPSSSYFYGNYRLAHRAIASSTNQRTMIMCLLPRNVFTGNSLKIDVAPKTNLDKLIILAFMNSLITDFYIRSTVSANLNTHYVYQLPIPRLSPSDAGYQLLLEGASQLVCTDELFASLWEEAIGKKWTPKCGVKNSFDRIHLQAKMDAQVAHIYGLTDNEFQYILSTFPGVEPIHKQLTLNYFTEIIPKETAVKSKITIE